MNPSDWRIFAIFTAVVVAFAAAFYWRFGDPYRSDRIKAKWGPATYWLLSLALLASVIDHIAKRDWTPAAVHGLVLLGYIWAWRSNRRKTLRRQ